MSTVSKIIEILDPQAGVIKETVLEEKQETDVQLFEQKPGKRRMTLEEASVTSDHLATVGGYHALGQGK